MNKKESLKIELELNEKYFKNDNIKYDKISQIYLYLSSTYKITLLLIYESGGSTCFSPYAYTF